MKTYEGPMRHFIAYHNTEKMGYNLHEEPFRLLTNKSVNNLLQNMVWFVVGQGSDRQYSLDSVFQVAEIGDNGDENFKHFATGLGHRFEPPIAIKGLPWFQEILRFTGNFSLGVQEVKDEFIIAQLIELATHDGYVIPASQE